MTRIVEQRAGVLVSSEAAESSTGFGDAGRIPQLDAAGLLDPSFFPGSGLSIAWGDITGTLSDQTDLQTALDLKIDDSQAGAFGLTLLGTANLAAAKTALAYVKADVGLGSADNTADAAKNVLSATKLITARNINGIAFDGTADITINAVDATARVPETRTITTTAPLTGGGDLSADRVFGISAASGAAAGSMSAADFTKLGGIAAGATANSTDAFLLARANHTGTQPIATILAAATARFFGRITVAGGAGEELTGTQATTLLDVVTTSLKGLAPASGGGTVNYLRADGSWAAPPGAASGTVTTVSVVTANGVSGVVANPTTAPAITITLGAITPSSVVSSGAITGTALTGTGLSITQVTAGVSAAVVEGVSGAGIVADFLGGGDNYYDAGTHIWRTIAGVQQANLTITGLVVAGTVAGTNITAGGNTTGNSATTTKWATGRTVTTTGDATGVSGAFDGSADLSFALTIPAGTVTLAKQANIATDRLIGRDTAGTGVPEVLTVGGGIEFTGAGGIQTSAFTGDVTKTAGGTALTIANDAVTYAKMQNVSATDRLLGRSTAGAGDTEEIPCTSVARTLISQTTQALMRTTGLGLGTSATVNTGTSGAVLGLLSTDNTYGAYQQFGAGARVTGSSSPSSSAGIEFSYTGGAGAIYAYDRTGGAYKPMTYGGLTVKIQVNGGLPANYVNDAAAAAGGVGVGETYRNGSILMVRAA